MTNKEFLIKELPDDEFASLLIKERHLMKYDNLERKTYEIHAFVSPDGGEWFVYDDAIDATIEWLNSDYSDDNMEMVFF